MPDADEAARQHMQQKATQELIDVQSQKSLLILVSGVAPAERHRVLDEGNEPVIGNCNAMGVGAEITKHLIESAERWFAVDHHTGWSKRRVFAHGCRNKVMQRWWVRAESWLIPETTGSTTEVVEAQAGGGMSLNVVMRRTKASRHGHLCGGSFTPLVEKSAFTTGDDPLRGKFIAPDRRAHRWRKRLQGRKRPATC